MDKLKIVSNRFVFSSLGIVGLGDEYRLEKSTQRVVH